MYPQQITEMVYHLKEGVNLENVIPSDPSLAVQTSAQLVNTIEAPKGFRRQFWVSDLCSSLPS
jgi:hypothetical protein